MQLNYSIRANHLVITLFLYTTYIYMWQVKWPTLSFEPHHAFTPRTFVSKSQLKFITYYGVDMVHSFLESYHGVGFISYRGPLHARNDLVSYMYHLLKKVVI